MINIETLLDRLNSYIETKDTSKINSVARQINTNLTLDEEKLDFKDIWVRLNEQLRYNDITGAKNLVNGFKNRYINIYKEKESSIVNNDEKITKQNLIELYKKNYAVFVFDEKEYYKLVDFISGKKSFKIDNAEYKFDGEYELYPAEQKDIYDHVFNYLATDKEKETFINMITDTENSNDIPQSVYDEYVEMKKELEEEKHYREENSTTPEEEKIEKNETEETQKLKEEVIDNENTNNNTDESEIQNIKENKKDELSFETDGPAIKKYKEETEKLEEEIRKLEELEQNEELVLDEASKNIINELEQDIKEQEQILETYKRRKENLIERNNPSNDPDKTYTLEVIKNAEYQIQEQTKVVKNLKIKLQETKKELEEKYKENRIKELEEKYKEIEIEQDNYYKQNKGVPVELYGRKKAIEDELNKLQNSSKKKEIEERKKELEERKNNIKTYYECLEEIKQLNNIDKDSEEYKNRFDKLNEKIATLPNELQEELKEYLKLDKKVEKDTEPKKKKGLKVKAKRALNWVKEHKLTAIAIGLALLVTTYLTMSSLMVINSGLWGLLGGKGAICSALHGINSGLSKVVGFGKYNFADNGLYLNGAGQALYETTAPKLIEALTLLGGSGLAYKKIANKIKSIANKKENPENNIDSKKSHKEEENKLENDKKKEKSAIIDVIKEKGSTIISSGKEKINQIKDKYTNESESPYVDEDKTVENDKKDTTNLTKEQIAEMIKEEVEKQREEDNKKIEELEKKLQKSEQENTYFKEMFQNLINNGKLTEEDLTAALNKEQEETNEKTK